MRNVDQRFFTIQYRRSSTDDTSRADDPSRKLVDGVPADRPLPIPRSSPLRDGKHPATAAADEHYAIPFPSAANRGASRSSATDLQRAQSIHLRSPPDLRGAGGIWLNPIPTHPQLTSAVSPMMGRIRQSPSTHSQQPSGKTHRAAGIHSPCRPMSQNVSAERQGFEPWDELPHLRFSRPVTRCRNQSHGKEIWQRS